MINDNPRNPRESAETRLTAAGARTLSWLVEDRLSIERTEIRRTFHKASDSIGGPIETTWWQIFSEAASDLGLRPSVLDCSVDQAEGLVRDGADLILFGGLEPYGWTVLRGRRETPVALWQPGAESEQILKRSNRVRSELAQYATDGRIRCVAFDWWDTGSRGTADSSRHAKPLKRLRELLRPETTDIWLVVVFAFVVGILALATPIAVESLVNTVAFGRYLQPIVILALLMFCFLAFSAAVTTLQTCVVEIIQQRLFARVASDLASRLPRVSMEATEGVYLPELVNRFFDVVTVQKVSAQLLLDGVSLLLTVVIGMIVLGFYHPFLLGFDVFLLISIVFLIFVLGRGAVTSAIKESNTKYYMAGWLEDVARCPTTFRTGAGKNLSATRSDRLIHNYLVARKSHFRILLGQIIFSLGLYAVASTVLLGLGGWLVVSGELTLGQLVAAELIVAVIVGAFAKIGKHLESFYDLLASVDKLGFLFDLPNERQGGILSSGGEQAAGVELERVSYSRDGRRLFDPVTTSLEPRETLAVLGPTGCGKSTLLDLLYGSRRPSSGHIRVNGRQPIDMQTDDYRSHVDLLRAGEFFQGTVAENIHIQRPGISGEQVQQALEAVGLIDVVIALPEGLETKLSSSGSPLTDGQLRLLILARSIAGQPSLMLVDGLLDGLPDSDLEPVFDAVLGPDRPWTVVAATGRQSLAERFVKVVRLPQEGRSPAPGSYVS